MKEAIEDAEASEAALLHFKENENVLKERISELEEEVAGIQEIAANAASAREHLEGALGRSLTALLNSFDPPAAAQGLAAAAEPSPEPTPEPDGFNLAAAPMVHAYVAQDVVEVHFDSSSDAATDNDAAAAAATDNFLP